MLQYRCSVELIFELSHCGCPGSSVVIKHLSSDQVSMGPIPTDFSWISLIVSSVSVIRHTRVTLSGK